MGMGSLESSSLGLNDGIMSLSDYFTLYSII